MPKTIQFKKKFPAGLAYAVPAYVIWGLTPIYWKMLQSVPAFEILMHRMIWSFLFLMPLLAITGQWKEFTGVFRNIRSLFILITTTTLIGINWFTYIWAINSDQVLQTSLGYYIYPLVNISLGVVFLKEKLRKMQAAAVILAGVAVLHLAVRFGQIPWIALTLAFTLGFYGLIRKVAAIGALSGLCLETLLFSIPAAFYLIYLDEIGKGAFLRIGMETDLLLMASALATGLPLFLFLSGAKRLNLTTIGFLQYSSPSLTFILAIFLFKEPFTRIQLFTFILIWTALALYTYDSVRYYRTQSHMKEHSGSQVG